MIKFGVHRISSVFIGVFILLSCTLHAQKIFYSNAERLAPLYDIIFVTGKQDNNIVVWYYRYSNHHLHVSVYDDQMNLLQHTSLKIVGLRKFYSFNFLRKNNSNEVLLQYAVKEGSKAAVFSYKVQTNVLAMSNVLKQSEAACCSAVLKQSPDGNYIALISAYNTGRDSVLVEYNLYNSYNERVKNISFLLPQVQQWQWMDFDGALLDNAGNLFFTSLRNEAAVTGAGQHMTVYGVNLLKDSLLENSFFRQGSFANVRLQQNYTSNHLTISGIWTDKVQNTASIKENKYLFLMELNENLSQVDEMTLFSTSKLFNVTNVVPFDIKKAKLLLYKDSGYLFYLTGLVNYRRIVLARSNETSAPMAGNFYANRPSKADLSGSVTYHPLPYGSSPSPYLNNNNGPYYRSADEGKNFFMTFSIADKKIADVNTYSDTTVGNSHPQYEFVANTGKDLHYIYSRLVKKDKQLLYDVVYEPSGQMHVNPVLAQSGYKLFVGDGVQVSSNTIIFPFNDRNTMSFAKMDIE